MSEEFDVVPDDGLPRWVWLVGALVALALVGGIGELSGAGWFAHRSVLWEPGELYVLNMSEVEVFVTADRGKQIAVPAQNAELVPLVGGTSKIVIVDKAGELVMSREVTIDGSHALLKLGAPTCLAVADMAPLYGAGGGSGDGVPVLDVIKAEDVVWVAGSRNVMWPRKEPPKKISSSWGLGRWVELVGCELLDDRAFLSGFLGLKLQERVQKMKEREAAGRAVTPTL